MDLGLFTARLKANYPVDPVPRPDLSLPQAAVLVILYRKDNRVHVLLTQRAAHLQYHAGEIAFPGGMNGEEDADLLATALRETREEVGIDVERNSFFAQLSPVITLKEVHITPFLTIRDELPKYQENPQEVETVLEVPLVALFSTQQRDIGYKPEQEMYQFWYKHHRVWGATARILHEMATLSPT